MKTTTVPLIRRNSPNTKLHYMEERFKHIPEVWEWYQEQCKKHNIDKTHQKRVIALLAYRKSQGYPLSVCFRYSFEDKHVKNAAIVMRDNLGLLEQLVGTTIARYVGE